MSLISKADMISAPQAAFEQFDLQPHVKEVYGLPGYEESMGIVEMSILMSSVPNAIIPKIISLLRSWVDSKYRSDIVFTLLDSEVVPVDDEHVKLKIWLH